MMPCRAGLKDLHRNRISRYGMSYVGKLIQRDFSCAKGGNGGFLQVAVSREYLYIWKFP